MASTPTEPPGDDDARDGPGERARRLRAWLLRLVDAARADGGYVWRVLVRTVAGRTAYVRLDDVVLRLAATGEGDGLRVEVDRIEPAAVPGALHFSSSAEALRDVIAGRLTLDATVAAGHVHVRAPFEDLLRVHSLVTAILAQGPVDRRFRALWDEFDGSWLRPLEPPPCRPLESQRPVFGTLVRLVSLDVLHIRVE
jgi:hypothetical protein